MLSIPVFVSCTVLKNKSHFLRDKFWFSNTSHEAHNIYINMNIWESSAVWKVYRFTVNSTCAQMRCRVVHSCDANLVRGCTAYDEDSYGAQVVHSCDVPFVHCWEFSNCAQPLCSSWAQLLWSSFAQLLWSSFAQLLWLRFAQLLWSSLSQLLWSSFAQLLWSSFAQLLWSSFAQLLWSSFAQLLWSSFAQLRCIRQEQLLSSLSWPWTLRDICVTKETVQSAQSTIKHGTLRRSHQ